MSLISKFSWEKVAVQKKIWAIHYACKAILECFGIDVPTAVFLNVPCIVFYRSHARWATCSLFYLLVTPWMPPPLIVYTSIAYRVPGSLRAWRSDNRVVSSEKEKAVTRGITAGKRQEYIVRTDLIPGGDYCRKTYYILNDIFNFNSCNLR